MFKTTLQAAMKNVETSLRLFGNDSGSYVREVVISSNVSIGVSKPSDSGVAVWFIWKGEQRCFAVDLYEKVEDNLQAIYHVLEARRTEMRHAGIVMAQAAMAGFTALLEGPKHRHWWDALEVSRFADKETVERAYKLAAQKHHPDKGGDGDKMAEITRAWAEAKKEMNW